MYNERQCYLQNLTDNKLLAIKKKNKNKLLSLGSLSIGAFCILMRLGYPMLMTRHWLFYVLPILSFLAILFGCISLSNESKNKKPNRFWLYATCDFHWRYLFFTI
jgi:hypothetical protein